MYSSVSCVLLQFPEANTAVCVILSILPVIKLSEILVCEKSEIRSDLLYSHMFEVSDVFEEP